ncbi:MAG: radical SAM protein [Candidatus Omnitrophota bacterium]
MKVLLIYPPKFNLVTPALPEVQERGLGFFPPLGLMYIAAHLKKYTQHNVEILDADVERLSYEEIRDEVKMRKPDVVGITAMTYMLYDAISVARVVKEADKNIHINLGGPHVNIYPQETINFPFVDSVTLGEGEITLTEFVDALSQKDSLKRIKGIVYKENGNIFYNEPRELVKDIDILPYPDRRIINYKKYYNIMSRNQISTTMITSRGCSNRCIFCDIPHKTVRYRSIENVLEEVKDCLKLGVREIYFYDDTFNLDKRRVIEFCSKIIEEGFKFSWTFRGRIKPLDEEMLAKLSKAGCQRIQFGVESGNEEILKLIRKNITLEEVKQAFRLTRKFGISSSAYFMIGFPNESKEMVLETIKFVNELNPDYVAFSVTQPFPNTELYKMGLERGIFKTDFWKDFACNPKINFAPFLWEETLSREQMYELQRVALRSFYLRPRYLIKSVLDCRSPREFLRKLYGGIKLFIGLC